MPNLPSARTERVQTSSDPIQGDLAQAVSDHDKMRKHFENQEKVEIKIRKEDGEQFVQVNGYSFAIAAGIPVKVPKQVAQILRDAGII
jgi:outer membrane lipoprotein SlyB